jgi:hypothetical protein
MRMFRKENKILRKDVEERNLKQILQNRPKNSVIKNKVFNLTKMIDGKEINLLRTVVIGILYINI